MRDFKTVSARLTEEQLAALNLRLKQLGFENVNQFVHALANGVLDNRVLLEGLANMLAERIVDKLSTNTAPATQKLVVRPPGLAPPDSGFEPGTASLGGFRAEGLASSWLPKPG